MKSKKKSDRSVEDKTRSVGPHGTFTPPPHPKPGHTRPKVEVQGESKKHPGSPKHGGQLFHGSS